MAKRYVRLKAPEEFNVWVEERRKNMEALAREMGNRKRVPKMKAMRLIATTHSIPVNEEMLKKLKKKAS